MSHLRGWLGLFAFAGTLLSAASAQALVFTVDATVDAVDETPGDGICATAPLRKLGQVCTLRAATQEAHALGGPHTIVLPSGTYTLSLKSDAATDFTSDASGPLKIHSGVTLTGAGGLTTVIDANHLYRVLIVRGTASISGVTIQGGRLVVAGLFGEFSGGGIFNVGTLTLTASRVLHNSAGSGGGIYNVPIGDLTMAGVFVGHNAAVAGGGGIDNDGSMTITDSSISSNAADDQGGGILNTGTLTISHSTVSDNAAYESNGGGIVNRDTMVIEHSTVASNTAGRGGGGILNFGTNPDEFIPGPFGSGVFGTPALLTITHSTIRNNSGFDGDGGGIHSSGFATLTLVNSTISGNGVEFNGGGIANGGAMTATNTTIADNVADPVHGTGGGLFTWDSSFDDEPLPVSELRNTLVADNSNDDCAGAAPTSLGHNLDTDGTCGLSAFGDLSDVSALLAPLALNGGPTMTHALLAGSAAIDTGGSAGCPADDQRGVARPQGAACDIGAFERSGESRSSNLSISIQANPSVRRGSLLRYTLTVTNGGAENADGLTVIDRLPPHVVVTAMQSSQGACTASTRGHTGIVTCRLGQLAPDGVVTVNLDVTPERPGTLVNTAIVTGDVAEADRRDNRATIKTTVR
jgi:uncharacterized repeat protein (TIGR01451 family)